MSEEKQKKRFSLPIEPPEPPTPLDLLEQVESAIEDVEGNVTEFDRKVRDFELKATHIDRKFSLPAPPKKPPEKPEKKNPESGRTYEGQSDEAYCLECVEGHTMTGLTEMRHATDRFRSAGKMTDGVTEKVRAAIRALQGIPEDVKSTENASPEVKKGLDEILDEVRWIRKEFGISGKGLTTGNGNMQDLEELRNRILILQNKAYSLVEKCPTCKSRREKVA